MKLGIPITCGYVPMGIGYAALAIKAGLTPFQTVIMSVLIYAGAGQIMIATMLAQGATLFAIVLTSFVLNLRYFVMNACIFNKVEDAPLPVRILSSHLAVDESFAMFMLMEESSIWTYIGLAGFAWVSWIFGAIIGVLILNLLPVIVANSFNISLYALFVALLVPAVKESKDLVILVILTAILNFILQLFIGNWSLIVATILGAVAGMYIVDDETILGESYNKDDDSKSNSCKTKEVQ
ncbi:AzlC family ABC transporter permease [uncultured Methanobrevibacter sp.]|uniref:AzlC family ABC transporter permease n=1 Tax=uncultured Methanobrevibacter sp. TaxID=253161 RepID=UPI0025CC9929|nr:AzlC family ABC transporter permease [uncultured Methanobrevibacter sp.]